MDPKNSSFVTIDPANASVQENYRLLSAGVSPRPIALVSTIAKDGRSNLSPFSFFNVFGANPPVIGFSPTLRGRDGSLKDTLRNLQDVPECVVQCVPFALVHQASLSSTEYPPGVDEFIKSGLTPLDSESVTPKRVKESPFQMECKVMQIIPLGGLQASGNLVLCEVVRFHVSPKILKDGIIDPNLIDLAGRNSGDYYTRASGHALFEIEKPLSTMGIGVDQLPLHIRKSDILSANNLGQLGGAERLPDESDLEAMLNQYRSALLNADQIMASMDSEDPQKLFICAWSLSYSQPEKCRQLLEVSAKKALEHKDVSFALKILCAIPQIMEEANRHA